MTVEQLIRELKKQVKNGNGEYEIRLFGHDHNPENYNEGVGILFSVNEYCNNKNEVFVALST